MASQEKQETIEEKKASNEAIDLQAIHNPITTENKKGQMEIESDGLDGNIVNKEGDLVKEETEIPSKLGIFVGPNQIITEKPESLEGELKEQQVLRHEEAPSPLEEPTAQEQLEEEVNGETENELYSTQFTEQLSPELILKGNAIQEKIDTVQVMKEDAHQNQISEKDETEKDPIQSNSMVALSEKDSQKEVELPIVNASQNPEEDVTKEVEIPSSTTPLVPEEILEEAKGENDALEEVQKEQIYQIETDKETMAEEKEYPDETEDQNRDVSSVVTSEETIPEEASQENQTPEMTARETMAEEKECPDETEDQNRDVSMVVTSEETIPEEASQENQTPEMICEEVKQTEDPTLCDQPITIEETSKSDEGEEVKENNVAATTPLISEEAEESADIKEEAHEDQIFKEYETGEDASQSISEVYLPEKYCENETEKTIENARGNPEEEEEEVTKEVENVSSVTPPVSEEVLEEAKEKLYAVEEMQNEQVAKEKEAEEKECNPAEAEVQNRDVSEVVVSEETMPEKASPEKEAPEMISEEVKPSDDTIVMAEKDETRQNDKEENAAHKDLTSSHETRTNEEICKTDEAEHISEKSTLGTVTTRDITPEIEIKDAETEALTSETDNRDIDKMENEEEAKSPEEVKQSESKDATMEIEEETLNDFEEEKSEGDNKRKNKETEDEQEVKSCIATEEQLHESKAPPSEEELSAERETIETKPIKETDGNEQNVAQNDITLDSKETFGNDEEAGEAMEMHIAEEHDTNNDINGDELGEGNGKDDEADKGNVEEISEPAKPINNTEASTDAEIPKEDIQLQGDNAVSAQLTEGEEALPDTPCESTTLSEMEKESTGYKALDSETDNMVVENSHEDDPNELPDKADKDASASEDQIEEDGKVNINEHEEVEQKLEVEEKTEENLFDNIEHEAAPIIQNEENPSEKDDNIKNEIIDESSEVEGSTEVIESPEEDVQNRTSERSYKQDQLVPEEATEQYCLKISSNDNESQTEKLEIGEASSQEEEKAGVILQNDDELDLKLKSEENIEAETVPNEEITQRVEEVEEPCITHNQEELPEGESTIECKETSNERSNSTIQQDQQSEESDAMTTEANQSTDDTSVEEGSETDTTLVSSTEQIDLQIDERSIAKDEGDKMQEEIIVVGTPKEKTEGESTEKQIEEIPEITNPSKVPEVDLSQSENLEVVSDEKLGDESKSTDTDSKSVELENTTHELTELKGSSIEPSNTRESQIDQVSQDSDVKPIHEPVVEQIGEGSVAKEESVILQEEDAEMIEAAANEKHKEEEEIPQTVHPSEITEEQLVDSETVGHEAERLEIVSNEKFGDESKLTETDFKSAQMESTPDELINLSSSERSEESEVLLQNTGEELQGERTDAEMPKEEICQAIEAAEEPCDKHVKGEILTTADLEICNASEELKSIFEQEKATEESASVEEKSDTSAILVPSEGQMEEKENAINESSIVTQSNTESVIIPEEKNSGGVETNDEPIDKVITGEIPQIVPTSEITEKQLVEREIVGPDAEHLEIVSNEKFGDVSKLSETDLTSDQMENTLNELIKEKSIADLSASVEQISERSEESEGLLQNTGEQVQGEKPDAEMPKEEIGQAIEAAEAPCDKHIEGEICKTRDLEIFDAAEESKAVLTEKEVDPQKFGTETESPEMEKATATEESASVEEKSDATAISVPGEGQIEEIEISNMESSGVPQSTTESVIVSEEKNDEPSDKDISAESSKIANPEIHDEAVQTKIVSNYEEVDSEKLGTEIESTELEKATEESTSVEEKSDAGADLVPSEEQIEEIEIANKESSVVPRNTVELVTVPEENVSQGIETNEEPSDKHIVGELHEKDISIDDKVDQGQTTASPLEEPDSKNFGTQMESAFLEKTNGDIDVKANLEKTTLTSFVEEEGAVINQTDNGLETVPVLEQTHEEQETELIDEKIVTTETEEIQVQEQALDTVVTEPENETKDEDLIRTETKEEISEIENVGQEKDIPTEFLKTAEQKVVVDETNEDTEESVRNFSEQNKEVEEETNQSEGPEHRDFASIVSSFLISKVLSEENPRTDDGAKQNNDASFIPKALDEETIPEIKTDKKEPETADEEISYATSLREEEKPKIQELEDENGEKKTEENGEGDGVEQDYLPVSRFLMDKILRQEENKNLGEEKAIEETDKQLVRDDAIQVEEKIEENSNPVMAPEQKGETPSSFAEVARDFEKEETLIKKVDDTFVGDGGISIEEKTEETSSVAALPKREGEGSHSSIEVARDFEEEKPADNAPKPVEDENKTVVSDVKILSVPEQEGEKSISPIEAVRDFEKEDKSIEKKNEASVTNEGISIIVKIADNTGEEMRDFDKDVKCAEIKDESLVSVDGACNLKRIEEENNKVALHEQEGETGSSLVEEVEDLANGEENKDLEEVLVNPREFSKPEKIIDQVHETEVIADEETPKDVKDVEENYVLVEHEVNQFEESKEILMQISDATIPNLEKKQNNSSAEIQDAESNLVRQVENTENGMKNSSVSCKEIEESLPDVPKLPMAGVETDATLQKPLEKQRDLEATEIRKELVGNETDYTRGEEQVKEVTGTVVERIQNKNQELTEIEATKIEKKSEEIKDEEHKEEEKEEEQEEEEKHRDETEIIGRDLTVKAEARETEMKSAQKKSHNILSGVGSKVKHSLAKVKKAITGKSKNVSPSAK